MIAAMKHDQLQFKLRMSEKLKSALEVQAANNDRTLTAEIVDRLEKSIQGMADPEVRELIVDQAKQLWEMRCRYAATHIYLLLAKRSLEQLGYSDEEKLQSIQAVLDRNEPHVAGPLSLRTELLQDTEFWRSELPQGVPESDLAAARAEAQPLLSRPKE